MRNSAEFSTAAQDFQRRIKTYLAVIPENPSIQFSHLEAPVASNPCLSRAWLNQDEMKACLQFGDGLRVKEVRAKHIRPSLFGQLHLKGEGAIVKLAQKWGMLTGGPGRGQLDEPTDLWLGESAYYFAITRLIELLALPGIKSNEVAIALKSLPEQTRSILRSYPGMDEIKWLFKCLDSGTDLLPHHSTIQGLTDTLELAIASKLAEETRVYFKPKRGFMPEIQPLSPLGLHYIRLTLQWGDSTFSERFCRNCGLPVPAIARSDAQFCQKACRQSHYRKNRVKARA
ncbi:MAG: hypothetical protein KF812_10405 [Fimbriimonadaceae bacterium]|nr:hypothetical protein [Fimbriimonadaceae bacterium]